MSVNRFLQFSHAVYIILLFVMYYVYSTPDNLISATVVVILVFTSLFMICVLAMTPEIIEAPMALLNLSLLAFFQLRALTLIFAPETKQYQINNIADAADYEQAALLMFAGTIMMAGGLLISAALFRQIKPAYPEGKRPILLWPQFPSTTILIGLSILYFPIALYSIVFDLIKIHPGATRTISTILMKLPPFIFRIDILLYLAIIVVLDRGWKNISFAAKLLSTTMVATFILMMIAIGTKSVIIEVFLYFMFGMYVVGRKIRLKAATIVVFIPVLIMLIVVGFYTGLFFRWYLPNIGPETTQAEITSQVTNLYESQILAQKQDNTALDILARFGSRLTGFDVLVVVGNDKFKSVNGKCDLLTEAQSFINMTFFPPERFPVPMTAQTFCVLYATEETEWYLNKSSYTTAIWYAWGLYFYHFGVFLGSAFLFLTTFIMSLVYAFLFHNFFGEIGIFFRMVWIRLFYLFFCTMGFDFLASYTIQFVMFGISSLIVLRFIFRGLTFFQVRW